VIIDPLINEPIEFYFNEDGLIEIEYLNNGNTDTLNLLSLVDELLADFQDDHGYVAPLKRDQVQDLFAVSGQLSMAANRINDFVRKYAPR